MSRASDATGTPLDVEAEAPCGEHNHFDMCSELGIGTYDAVSEEATLRLSRLPPFLRVLLFTDGTVTRTLAAYFFEPVDVDVLRHAEMRSTRGYPHLAVNPGDCILRRCVILRGGATQTIYAFAESIVVTACIPADLRRTLVEGRKGIGELIASARMETFRELLAVSRARAAPWATHLGVASDESVVTRSYRILFEGRAAIEITEVFPERAFLPDEASPEPSRATM